MKKRNRYNIYFATVFGILSTLALPSHSETSSAGRESVEFSRLESQLALNAAWIENFPSEAESEFIQSLSSLGIESPEEVMEFLERTQGETRGTFLYTQEKGLDSTIPHCNRFIGKDGTYGVYGRIVYEYLLSKYKSNRTTPMLADDLVGMEDAPGICPRWREFDTEERIKFWVWTFAAIAAQESQCGGHPRTFKPFKSMPICHPTKKTKKGGCVIVDWRYRAGLLQMEYHLRHRSWRGFASCKVKDSLIVQSVYNLKCGIDIMGGLISAKPPEKNPWPIYRAEKNDKSYWEELLKPKGGTIGKMIRSYEPCYSAPNP